MASIPTASALLQAYRAMAKFAPAPLLRVMAKRVANSSVPANTSNNATNRAETASCRLPCHHATASALLATVPYVNMCAARVMANHARKPGALVTANVPATLTVHVMAAPGPNMLAHLPVRGHAAMSLVTANVPRADRETVLRVLNVANRPVVSVLPAMNRIPRAIPAVPIRKANIT